MGQSQSTRSKTPSHRGDHQIGQPKVWDAVTSQGASTTSSSQLDNKDDNGFAMPATNALNYSIDETQSLQQVDNVTRHTIPTVTITGKKT